MTALPQPDGREDQSRSARGPWARALIEQAGLRERRSRQQLRVQRTIDAGAMDFLYPWSTDDGRELDIRVYYFSGSAIDVRAAELERIDGRAPTMRERAVYEDAFVCELESAGDLWESVASYIWERSSI